MTLLVTVYDEPDVPPDNHAVAVVVVLVSESNVIPVDTVTVEVDMVSIGLVFSHVLQSNL